MIKNALKYNICIKKECEKIRTKSKSVTPQILGDLLVNPIVSIIIVTHNSERVIENCLRSILNQNFLKYEIIVVDGDSTDKTKEIVKKYTMKYKQIKLLEQKNLGFSKLNNIGAKKAKGRYLLFLNPDTRIEDPNMIPVLIHKINQNKKIGAIGPLQYYYKNLKKKYHNIFVIIPVGFVVHLPFDLIFRYLSKKYSRSDILKNKINEKEVDYISGAAVLIKKDLYKKIDGFDENIFMYYEDSDLCMKIWKLGLHCIVTKDTEIFHEGGKGSKTETTFLNYHYWRSRVIFTRKWDKDLQNLLPIFLIFGILRRLISMRFDTISAAIKGYIDGYKYKMGSK